MDKLKKRKNGIRKMVLFAASLIIFLFLFRHWDEVKALLAGFIQK